MEEDFEAKLERQHRTSRILGGIVAAIGIAIVVALIVLRAYGNAVIGH